MRSRLFAAACAALALAALPAAAQSARGHIANAKKAEKQKQFKKMLAEYQAACALQSDSDCQLGMADAYARLGQKDKAREIYQVLINDPFAQDAAVDKARSAMAKLDAGGAAPDLPDLGTSKPAVVAAAPGLPSLDLPDAAPAPKKTGKKAEAAAAAPPLDLPPLDAVPDLPGAALAKKGGKKAETKVAAAPPPLDLPGLDPIDAARDGKKSKPAKKDTLARKDASPALPSLDLPADPKPAVGPALPSLDFAPPGDAKRGDPKKDAVATASPKAKDAVARPPAKDNRVAMATPPSPKKDAPKDHLSSTQPKDRVAKDALVAPIDRAPAPASSSRATRTIAWITTGVAVAALGGGAYAYTKATSAQSDLHSGVRSGAANQQLIDQQKLNRSLSAVGLLGGVVAGGVAAMLFTF